MLRFSTAAVIFCVLLLAACGPAVQSGLAPALTARMDSGGARLDAGQALGIVNAYRVSVGAAPVSLDPGLSGVADGLARAYATSGRQPQTPASASAMRVSAGYPTFADTFSGWRNSPPDAAVLARPAARRAGLAVVHSAASEYGTYWVLLLAD